MIKQRVSRGHNTQNPFSGPKSLVRWFLGLFVKTGTRAPKGVSFRSLVFLSLCPETGNRAPSGASFRLLSPSHGPHTDRREIASEGGKLTDFESQEDVSMKRELASWFAVVSLAAVYSLLPSQVSAAPPAGVAPGSQTIVEIVNEAASDDPAEFSLLLDAVLYIADTNPDSALVAGLFDAEQYTVFAPTDQAFLALVDAIDDLLDQDILNDEGPFAAIDDLLGEGTVEAVVSYHVTGGRRASNSVVPTRRDRNITTLLEDATFSVSSAGVITAVGSTAAIGPADISASNGVIHIVDAVLLPIDLGL